MFFSPSCNAFYPESLRARYEAAGSWPDDAIEVTDDDWKIYGQGSAPSGMQRGADENGRPSWVPIPLPDLSEAVTAKVDDIKLQALSILSDSDWYVVRLQETGDAIPEEVKKFRAAVRQATETAEADISAMTDAAEVLSYRVAWPIR